MVDKTGGIHRCPNGHGEFYGEDCPACEDGIPILRLMSVVLDELTWGWKVVVAVGIDGHLRITAEHDAGGERREVHLLTEEDNREESEPLALHFTTDVVEAGFIP
jgi:hypothetical protein